MTDFLVLLYVTGCCLAVTFLAAGISWLIDHVRHEVIDTAPGISHVRVIPTQDERQVS